VQPDTHLNQLRIGLEEYRAGRLSLHALSTHLDSHLRALEHQGVPRHVQLTKAWEDLETINALVLDAQERSASPDVSDDDVERVVSALENLVRSALVRSRLPDSD